MMNPGLSSSHDKNGLLPSRELERFLRLVAIRAQQFGISNDEASKVIAAADQVGAVLNMDPTLGLGWRSKLLEGAAEGVSLAVSIAASNPVIRESLAAQGVTIPGDTEPNKVEPAAMPMPMSVGPSPVVEVPDSKLILDLITSNNPTINLFQVGEAPSDRPITFSDGPATAVLHVLTPVFSDGLTQAAKFDRSWERVEIAGHSKNAKNPQSEFVWNVSDLPRSNGAVLVPTLLNLEIESVQVERGGEVLPRNATGLYRGPSGQLAISGISANSSGKIKVSFGAKRTADAELKMQTAKFRLATNDQLTLGTAALGIGDADKIKTAQKLFADVKWLDIQDVQQLRPFLSRYPGDSVEFIAGFGGGNTLTRYLLFAGYLVKAGIPTQLALCVDPNNVAAAAELRLLVCKDGALALLDLGPNSSAREDDNRADRGAIEVRIAKLAKDQSFIDSLPASAEDAGKLVRQTCEAATELTLEDIGPSALLRSFLNSSIESSSEAALQSFFGSLTSPSEDEWLADVKKFLTAYGPSIAQSLEAAMVAVCRDGDPRLLGKWIKRAMILNSSSDYTDDFSSVLGLLSPRDRAVPDGAQRRAAIITEYLERFHPRLIQALPAVAAEAVWHLEHARDGDIPSRVAILAELGINNLGIHETYQKIGLASSQEIFSDRHTHDLTKLGTKYLISIAGKAPKTFTDWGLVQPTNMLYPLAPLLPEVQVGIDRVWRELLKRIPQMKDSPSELFSFAKVLAAAVYTNSSDCLASLRMDKSGN